MNADSEKPKINPLIYRRNILNIIPIIVIPKVHIINEYDKINSRNKKKDDLHLNKHIMHLCRLKYTLWDILKEYDIITYRPERDFLLQIRNGLFVTEDRKIVPTFYDWLEEMDCKIEEALKKTLVPDEPDYKGIQDFVIKVNNFTLEKDKVTLGW